MRVEEVVLEEEEHGEPVGHLRQRLGDDAGLQQRDGGDVDGVVLGERAGAGAGGVDERGGRDGSGGRLGRGDVAALGLRAEGGDAGAHVDSGELESPAERAHHAPGRDLAALRLIQPAVDGGAVEQRRQPAGLVGVDEFDVGERPLALLLLEEHLDALGRERGEEEADVAHAEVLAALVLEALVELDPVAGELGLQLAGPIADEPGAGVGRLAAELRLALEQHDVAHAALGEVERQAGAEDPAAGDDDVRAHERAPALTSRPPRRRGGSSA